MNLHSHIYTLAWLHHIFIITKTRIGRSLNLLALLLLRVPLNPVHEQIQPPLLVVQIHQPL